MDNSSFIRNLKSGLGWSYSYTAILTSCILILTAFFYIYLVASYLKAPIVIFQNGVTYSAIFENTFLIGKNWDYLFTISLTVVWLFLSIRNKKLGISTSLIYTGLAVTAGLSGFSVFYDLVVFMTLPFIISLLIFNKILKEKNILKSDTNLLIINYFSVAVFISAVIGVILSSSFLLFSVPPSALFVHNYTYPLYVLFSNFSPVLIFLLLFSFIVKFLVKEFRIEKLWTRNNVTHEKESIFSKSVNLSIRTKFLFMLFFIILSITISLIPHSPIVNTTDQQIGVDMDEYKKWITILMNSSSSQELLEQAFIVESSGDRPLTLLFLLSIVKITQMNDSLIVEYMPAILGPLLIVSIYFLTRELTLNDKISLIAAFLTAVSFHMLVGIYAGLLANWLALVIGYFSFVFLFKYLKNKGSNNIVIYFVLVTLSLFVHVYTWTIFTIVTYVFLIISLKMNIYVRRKVILSILTLSFSVIIDIARIAITGSSSSGVQEAIYIANLGLDLDQFAQRWNNLTFATQIYVGGIFSNFILFALGIYWLLRSNLKEPSSIFLIVFMSIGIVPLFIGDEFIQARVLYDIPFQIPAAIALSQLMKNIKGKMMVISICSWLLFIAVRTSINFYYVLPS